MLKITLINGHKTVLMDHNRLITFDEDLVLREVLSGSICTSKILPVATTLPEMNIPLPDVPFPLTRASGYLVGHYLGDGGAYDSENHVRFTSFDSGHLKVLKCRIIEAGLKPFLINSEVGCRGFRVYGASLYRWFRSEFRVLSASKRLPPWVLAAPVDFRKGVLDGLLSSDGRIGIDAGRNRDDPVANIRLKNNYGLVLGAAILARSLGIFSSMGVPDALGIPQQVTFDFGDLANFSVSHPDRQRLLSAGLANYEPTRGYLRVVPWNRAIRQRLQDVVGLRRDAEPGLSTCYSSKGHMSLIKARQMIGKHQLLRYASDPMIGRWITLASSTEVTWVPIAELNASRQEPVSFGALESEPHLEVCPSSGIINLSYHAPADGKTLQDECHQLLPHVWRRPPCEFTTLLARCSEDNQQSCHVSRNKSIRAVAQSCRERRSTTTKSLTTSD